MQTLAEINLAGIEKYLLAVLKDDPLESRPQKYVEALNGIGREGIRKFLVSLLENGIPASIVSSSYFHPNKFFKLGICRLPNRVKLRLHFWNKEHLQVQTPIHAHAWDFASLLLCGSYAHDTFSVKELDRDSVARVEDFLKSSRSMDSKCIPENYLGMYKIPKRDETLGKFRPEWVKYVQAEKISRTIEKEGSTYYLGMEFPHRITINLKEVGSMITLVLTSETNRENLFTFQPVIQTKVFDNPSPNVDEAMVRAQVEVILDEMSQREKK